MKNLILILICLSSLKLFSQSIEVVGGLNKNVFFDYWDGEARFNSSYTSELGFVGRIGLDIKLDWLKTRFTLSFDKYSGKLIASDGGQAGSHTTIADIDKSIISFGFFPINFNVSTSSSFII